MLQSTQNDKRGKNFSLGFKSAEEAINTLSTGHRVTTTFKS